MKRILLTAAALLASVMMMTGCGKTSKPEITEPQITEPQITEPQITEPQITKSEVVEEVESPAPIDPDGVYDSKDEVALYIHTYDRLPSNYITKKEAKELGWEGGSLEPYAPGKCIGGDYFGNYEGNLPEDDNREYHECDIDTLGRDSRGAKRIVYSDDGLIFYTGDHYDSFEQLY